MLSNFLAWIDTCPPWTVELAVLTWMVGMFALVHLFEQRSK